MCAALPRPPAMPQSKAEVDREKERNPVPSKNEVPRATSHGEWQFAHATPAVPT